MAARRGASAEPSTTPQASGAWTSTSATTPTRAPRANSVVLLITEALGGIHIHAGAARLLNQLEKAAKKKGGRDGTVYGRSRMAAKSFGSHHIRMISTSIAKSVASSIACWRDARANELLHRDTPHGGTATAF